MRQKFCSDTQKSQYIQITNMWDEMLKPPKDVQAMQAYVETKEQIQIFMNSAIALSAALIKDAFTKIEKCSKTYSPSSLFEGMKKKKEKIIAAQQEIIMKNLIPLKHFSEYAQKQGLTNEHQAEYKSILDKVAKAFPEIMDKEDNNAENPKPLFPPKKPF